MADVLHPFKSKKPKGQTKAVVSATRRSSSWVRDAVGASQAGAVEAGAMATTVLLAAPQRPQVRGHVDPLPRSRRRLQCPLHLLMALFVAAVTTKPLLGY
jgi:hypothetical protein